MLIRERPGVVSRPIGKNIVGPLSPPSEGHRFFLTVIDLCTRFPDAVPLKDIHTSTVAEALIGISLGLGLLVKLDAVVWILLWMSLFGLTDSQYNVL